jgi:hypothetical protein
MHWHSRLLSVEKELVSSDAIDSAHHGVANSHSGLAE